MKHISVLILIILFFTSCVSKKSLYSDENIENSILKSKKIYNKGANTLGLTFSFGAAAAGAYYAREKNLFITSDKDGNKISNKNVNSAIGGVLGFGLGSFITYLLTPSSEKQYNKAINNFKLGNLQKAETQFLKSYFYSKSPNSDIIHKSLFGLAQIQERNRNFNFAEKLTFAAYEKSKSNLDYKFNLSRYAALYDKSKAYDWLFSINDKDYALSVGRKSFFDDPLFLKLRTDKKFYRWCNGFRRLRFTVNSSQVNYREWGLNPEPDQFVTISTLHDNRKRNLLLATSEKENSSYAEWIRYSNANTVVFETYLGDPIFISQWDADYVDHHNFISELEINSLQGNPKDGTYNVKTSRGQINLSIFDTDEDTLSDNRSLPNLISYSEMFFYGFLGLAAANFGSEIFSNNSENNSNISFISCADKTSNETDIYILAIGTDPKVGADVDAKNLSSKLKEACGDPELYGNVFSITLTDTDATKGRINQALNEISQKTNHDDIFLLSFSGHGGVVDENFFFHTSDGDGVFIDDIIYGINADNCKSILWFDACRAGYVSFDFANKIDDYVRNKTCPNLSVLMSSSDNQASYGNKLEGGIFTKTILEGLSGSADTNNNGIISLEELEQFVRKEVPKKAAINSEVQNPQILKVGYEPFNTRLSRYK